MEEVGLIKKDRFLYKLFETGAFNKSFFATKLYGDDSEKDIINERKYAVKLYNKFAGKQQLSLDELETINKIFVDISVQIIELTKQSER